jgi:O-antigen/teichoic acid export membrane protein
MSEYKLYAQRIGLVGITNALLSINVVVLLPILTKNLSLEDYSIWVQANITVTLIAAVVLLGLPYTMVRFLSAEKIKENMQEGFYSIFATGMFMSLVASILIFFLAEPIAANLFNNNIIIARILSIIIFIECMNNCCLSFFRTFLRMKAYSLILLAKTYLNVILVTCFVIFNQGIIGAMTGFLITSIFVFLLMAYLIVKEIGIKIPRFKNMREYLAFGVPTIPGNLSYWIINSSACYIVSMQLGTAFVGYYSPGYTLGNINSIFIGPFSVLLSAMLARYYDANDINSIKNILTYSLKYFLAIAIPSTIGLALLSKPLLRILSSVEIANNGYLITPFIALSAMLYGAFVFFAEILSVNKKTEITGRIWIMAAILNLCLNFVLISQIGIVGAAFAVLITYALVLILGIYYSSKFISIEIDPGFIIKSVIASSLMSLVIIYVRPSSISEILSTIAACALFYGIVIMLFGGLGKEEKDFIGSLIKKNRD